jgi:predicted permease
MIRHYFRVAWRNLLRNRSFSVINILGLGLGMACSLLIFLWVADERSVDHFHEHGQQLYQVYERAFFDGKTEASFSTQGMLAEELKKAFAEIQYASSLEWNSTNTFEAGDKVIKMDGSFASDDFFSMFSYPVLEGKPATALHSLDGIAISRKMAELFFGSPAMAMGQTIRYENNQNLRITAVFENIATHSSYKFDFLRGWPAFIRENEDWINNWGSMDPQTFIQLRSDADPVKTRAKIKDFVSRFKPGNDHFRVELDLLPYTQKYLHAVFKSGYIDGGRIEYVRLFSIIAIFILLIACINFMNLATARSAKRAREVGVRKVIGAARLQLTLQFIGEALLLTALGVAVALFLCLAFLPLFNQLTGKELTLPFTQPIFWLSLLGLLLTTGLVAGSYPALFLSSLNPIRIFRGSLKLSGSPVFLRKTLVVFQFMLSAILIVGLIIIYRQMNYVQTRNLGYDRANLLYLPLEGELSDQYALFKQEAMKLPGIQAVTKARNVPTRIVSNTSSISWAGKDPNQVASFAYTVVGYDFVKTMHLELAEGRDFSEAYGTDSGAVVMNEAAVKKIGYKDPVGKTLTWDGRTVRIIGVLKDFHYNSLHQMIEPMVLQLNEQRRWGTILVRIQPGRTKEAIGSLEKLCKTINPRFPFTYQFSDEEYAKLYRSETLVSKLSWYFAFLGILISCLGLFGLTAFMAEQRTKEIGIRKVLGAQVNGIVAMLSKDFLKLVIIAIVLATPIAWYCMHRWLQDFEYRADITWWIFVLAAVVVVSIALLTVSLQAIRAALANPIRSLRTE